MNINTNNYNNLYKFLDNDYDEFYEEYNQNNNVIDCLAFSLLTISSVNNCIITIYTNSVELEINCDVFDLSHVSSTANHLEEVLPRNIFMCLRNDTVMGLYEQFLFLSNSFNFRVEIENL